MHVSEQCPVVILGKFPGIHYSLAILSLSLFHFALDHVMQKYDLMTSGTCAP